MGLKLKNLACQCLIVLVVATSSWCQVLKGGSERNDSFGLHILGSVGEPCAANVDCGEYEEWDPVFHRCNCIPDYIVSPRTGSCMPIINIIGSWCEDHVQCVYGSLGNLSWCFDNAGLTVCDCITDSVPDFYSDSHLHVCRPVVGKIGDECVIDEQCNFANSVCIEVGDGTKRCMCRSGTVEFENQCLVIAENVGDLCQTDIECQVGLGNLSLCDATTLKCECRIDAVASGDNERCLPFQNHLGGPCEEDIQCYYGIGENSVCTRLHVDKWQGVCTCHSASVEFQGRCLLLAENLGDPCQIDLQCQANLGNVTMCKENICQCNTSTSPQNGTECLALVHEIGGVCEVDQQCTQGTPGELSTCMQDGNSKTCQCLDEAINEIGEHVCRRKALTVGDQCLRNAQCKANLGNLSECLVGETCVCTPFYGVPSFIGDKCLPVVNFIGGECLERQQCTAGIPGEYSDCIDSPIIPDIKICNCSDGAENEPGRHECRFPRVFIGNPCQNDEQCVGEPGVSSGCGALGICGCLGGFVSSRDKDDCLPIRNQLGDSCLEHEQCQTGIPGPLSNCYNTCNCTEYAVNEPGQHYCHRKALLVGDACRVNIQCEANLGEYSHCLSGQCECKKGAEAAADLSTCLINLF